MLGLFFFLSSDQRLGQTHTRSRMAMTVAIRSHVRKPGWAGRWSPLESVLCNGGKSQQAGLRSGIRELPKQTGNSGLAWQLNHKRQRPSLCYNSMRQGFCNLKKKNQCGPLS